jgi:hypothetical protein
MLPENQNRWLSLPLLVEAEVVAGLGVVPAVVAEAPV